MVEIFDSATVTPLEKYAMCLNEQLAALTALVQRQEKRIEQLESETAGVRALASRVVLVGPDACLGYPDGEVAYTVFFRCNCAASRIDEIGGALLECVGDTVDYIYLFSMDDSEPAEARSRAWFALLVSDAGWKGVSHVELAEYLGQFKEHMWSLDMELVFNLVPATYIVVETSDEPELAEAIFS